MAKFITNIEEMQKYLKNTSGSIGLVPSLGNFHIGHKSLFEKSVAQNKHTIVSIVCLPIIFDDQNDFQNYPRTPQNDLKLVEEVGADVLFVPDNEALFKGPLLYKVIETKLSKQFEGFNRPGHFDGVLTVLLKLLQLLKPDRLYLGRKDYQQLELVQCMCEAFYLSTKIIPCPIIRESDGLAYSSRNSQLTTQQRVKAAEFPRLLKSRASPSDIALQLKDLGFDVQYIQDYKNVRLGAVKLGAVRLIDNVELVKHD